MVMVTIVNVYRYLEREKTTVGDQYRYIVCVCMCVCVCVRANDVLMIQVCIPLGSKSRCQCVKESAAGHCGRGKLGCSVLDSH